jgi:hypothetical protein
VVGGEISRSVARETREEFPGLARSGGNCLCSVVGHGRTDAVAQVQVAQVPALAICSTHPTDAPHEAEHRPTQERESRDVSCEYLQLRLGAVWAQFPQRSNHQLRCHSVRFAFSVNAILGSSPCKTAPAAKQRHVCCN